MKLTRFRPKIINPKTVISSLIDLLKHNHAPQVEKILTRALLDVKATIQKDTNKEGLKG